MNEKLTFTIVQSTLEWENPDLNKNHFSKLLENHKLLTDIIILPEMFTTGFSMRAKDLAEPSDGPTFQWMCTIAREKNAAICGSFIIKEDNCYYNRFIFVKPDNSFFSYNKRHLFRLAGETEYFTAGNERVVFEWKGWRILPLICYDLRFPVWCRNRNDFDIIINVANWPIIRAEAWKIFLKARAIENQAFVFGVNRVGQDGMGHNYSGDSGAYSPYGVALVEIPAAKQAIETISILKKDLNDCRTRHPFYKDADDFEIKL